MIDQIITRCFFDNACSAGQPKRKRRRKGSDHVPEKKTSATGGARRRAADLGCLLLGSACLGASVSLFSAPNDIAPGGVTGLATVLHRVVGLPIGVLCILLNLPLLAAAWRVLGRRFLRRSIAGLLLSSVATDLLGRVVRPMTNDLMLAALCAGVLTGAGLGLILSRGATTGGSEIAARLLERRFPHVPIGRLILLVDAAVIALSAAVFRRADAALYAVLLVTISSWVTDRIVSGGRRGMTALIFCRAPDTLVDGILQHLHRGVTVLTAAGGYSRRPAPALLCVVSRTEVHALRDLVFTHDPQAFFVLLPAAEILGHGFTSY